MGGLFLGQNSHGTSATATSTFTLSNVTIASNEAYDFGGSGFQGSGGGIEFATTTGSISTATLTNVTLVGNRAIAGGGGIDVASSFSGTVTLTNVTVNGNTGDYGGGVVFTGAAGGTVRVQNTLIGGNFGLGISSDISTGSAFTDLGNNLVAVLPPGSGFGPGTLTAPFIGGLQLGELTNNGGPLAGVTQFYGAGPGGNSPMGNQLTVETEALLPRSPARQKGAAITGLATDQRGFSRPPTAPDIGAFQFQNAGPLLIQLAATASNGATTITATVINTSTVNALPVDNSLLSVLLPAGLTANGATAFTLPALAAGQSITFTLTASGTPTGASTVVASVFSPDASPNTISTSVAISTPPSPPPPSLPTPVGQMLVFALGFANGQLVLFFVDANGQVFDEAFTFNNLFSPNPANATYINTDLVFRNLAPTDLFGSPGIVGILVGSDNTSYLMTTLPINFISPVALGDIFHALLRPGA